MNDRLSLSIFTIEIDGKPTRHATLTRQFHGIGLFNLKYFEPPTSSIK